MARTRAEAARESPTAAPRPVAVVTRPIRACRNQVAKEKIDTAEPRRAQGKDSSNAEKGVKKSRKLSRSKKARKAASSPDRHQHETIADHRKCCPEDFPDLDFNQAWGNFLTRRSPVAQVVDKDVARYWNLLNTTPALLQHHGPEICDLYHATFKGFFDVDAISIHGHVSDAANPFVLTSLLMHLEEKKPKENTATLLGEGHTSSPLIAVADDSYGSGSGPQAYGSVVKNFRTVGCGTRPVVVTTRKSGSINKQVKAAKEAGCVALIVEIVCAVDGSVMSSGSWETLLTSCKKHNLVLVVDEALTAIRCGAPFAYQLEQYSKHGYPDLVLFGKAVKTCGIAIDWRGINIQELGILDNDGGEAHMQIISSWQERYTEMAPVADLLTSIGTIKMAEKEDWPQRAQNIGKLLRDIVKGDTWCRPSRVRGLHSLIYIWLLDYAETSSPVMGALANDNIRWLPVMDEVMTSKDELMTKVFGKGSLAHRKEVAEWFESVDLQPQWCMMCGGTAGAEKRTLCRRCVGNRCKDCEPGPHVCPMESLVA